MPIIIYMNRINKDEFSFEKDSVIKRNEIIFPSTLDDVTNGRLYNYVVHFICTEGSCEFEIGGEHYKVKKNHLVIWSQPNLVSNLKTSDDFSFVSIAIANGFVSNDLPPLDNQFDTIGRMLLFKNPVLSLTAEERVRGISQILYIKGRLNEKQPFHRQLIQYSLAILFIDFFNVYIRVSGHLKINEQSVRVLTGFVKMLRRGDFRTQRSVAHYASELCVTAKYLSEICRRATGKAANWWIDQFTVNEIISLLRDGDLSFSKIAEDLNFSSISYFSRYVQHMLGMSPTNFRNGKRQSERAQD